MEKKTYYVTIHSGGMTGEIKEHVDLNDSNYDFEIMATPEEIHRLESLFEQAHKEDSQTFLDAHIPWIAHDKFGNSDAFDQKLKRIYQTIYELGTPETKQKMEQTGVVGFMRES
jgi:hypothetical protein